MAKPATPIFPQPAKPQFSMQDAQALIQLARRAPLPNMEVAEQAAQVIGRFAEWYPTTQVVKK